MRAATTSGRRIEKRICGSQGCWWLLWQTQDDEFRRMRGPADGDKQAIPEQILLPTGKFVLKSSDVLVVLGEDENLRQFQEAFR